MKRVLVHFSVRAVCDTVYINRKLCYLPHTFRTLTISFAQQPLISQVEKPCGTFRENLWEEGAQIL
jgi:hypothetical protein